MHLIMYISRRSETIVKEIGPQKLSELGSSPPLLGLSLTPHEIPSAAAAAAAGIYHLRPLPSAPLPISRHGLWLSLPREEETQRENNNRGDETAAKERALARKCRG